eukprot:30145-Pelagococcus_subviridis.AAC.5
MPAERVRHLGVEGPHEAMISGWSSKASDEVERRRGRDTPGEVLEDRRAPRRGRGRMRTGATQNAPRAPTRTRACCRRTRRGARRSRTRARRARTTR